MQYVQDQIQYSNLKIRGDVKAYFVMLCIIVIMTIDHDVRGGPPTVTESESVCRASDPHWGCKCITNENRKQHLDRVIYGDLQTQAHVMVHCKIICGDLELMIRNNQAQGIIIGIIGTN